MDAADSIICFFEHILGMLKKSLTKFIESDAFLPQFSSCVPSVFSR
ncbi:hypothetical protein AO382_0227 [Moraxella catarrhalis]|uniref:Uncharacterized protein n=1 Tax=Moraxella catarrhalis TaxID=480 RepID=A0A7Z1A4L9_MORCA|nr:hypothetical protein AO382_0227 [Moraxella catarrhalis]